MDLFTLALSLAQFAPSVMRFFGAGDKPVAVAEKVVDLAKTVTGQPTGEAALESLRQNSQLAQEFSLATLPLRLSTATGLNRLIRKWELQRMPTTASPKLL